MKSILLTIGLILFCTSCFVHEDRMINGQCRPKNPNFKLTKIPFKDSDLLAFNKIYIADDKTNAYGLWFLSRWKNYICALKRWSVTLKIEDIINKTWNNAPAIGYWRMERNKIKTEYFSCSNSGNYIRKQGYIKGDTIFFERDCRTRPFKQKICYDKYILSNMNFGNVPDVLFWVEKKH